MIFRTTPQSKRKGIITDYDNLQGSTRKTGSHRRNHFKDKFTNTNKIYPTKESTTTINSQEMYKTYVEETPIHYMFVKEGQT